MNIFMYRCLEFLTLRTSSQIKEIFIITSSEKVDV